MSLLDKIIIHKMCSKCKQLKGLEYFSKDKSSKSGLYSRCKECTKLETKQKSAEQKAKENERSKIYKANNKEKRKKYVLDNKERISENKRKRENRSKGNRV